MGVQKAALNSVGEIFDFRHAKASVSVLAATEIQFQNNLGHCSKIKIKLRNFKALFHRS